MTPQHRVLERMATWKTVAITLGAVVGALGLFGAGFVAGVATSSVARSSGALPEGSPGGGGTGGGTGGGGSDPAPTGGEPGGGVAASEFDDCLVGAWRTTDYEQRTTGPDGESVLSGLNPTVTVDESGRHVVTYDEVTPPDGSA